MNYHVYYNKDLAPHYFYLVPLSDALLFAAKSGIRNTQNDAQAGIIDLTARQKNISKITSAGPGMLMDASSFSSFSRPQFGSPALRKGNISMVANSLSYYPLTCQQEQQHSETDTEGDQPQLVDETQVVDPDKTLVDETESNYNSVDAKAPTAALSKPLNQRRSQSWSKEEESMLVHLRDVDNWPWKKIATKFPGRSLNSCQIRYRRLVK